MRLKTYILWLAVCMCGLCQAQSREILLLSDWRFHRGAAENAQATQYDDSQWENVCIPHDWAISGPFDKEIDKQVVAIVQNGESEATEKTGRSGSLPWIGEGWYRTTFSIPEGMGHAELIFDGAMAEPRVYLDGREVGYWAYGYNTFRIDITDALPTDRSAEGHIRPGEHTLAVHLQNMEESSRWYPGAGLYRPVRLVLGQRIGIKTWGTFARTTRLDSIDNLGQIAKCATLTVTTEVRKDMPLAANDIEVIHLLKNAAGQVVAETRKSLSESLETEQVVHVQNAELWSPEHPTLYQLCTRVRDNSGRIWDEQQLAIGIRLAEYTQNGFVLNGQSRKFKGVCLHHDLGPLGAAFNKAAFRRQVTLLKQIGCDAIRTSHNMPAPWQMDICDEMGMMVMAESCDMWVYPKCKNGYSRFFEQWWTRDFTNLVMVHRNHPSIVMWSIGNEIPEQGSALGLLYTRKIQELIHSLDPTRPCTQGMDRGDEAIQSGVFAATEIPGFNYRVHKYLRGVENSPKGILLGSETCSTVSSRGVYKFPVHEYFNQVYDDGQCSSYDLEACVWSNIPDDDWVWQDKAPWLMGEFVWTGFDYLGEPTPYDEYWPSRSSYFGIYDLAGLMKDRAWLYRVHWASDEPTLHLLPHWNWTGREGEITPVMCYTTYPEVELFVNGKSQGRLRHQDLSLDTYLEEQHEALTPWGETVLRANENAPAGRNRLDRYRLRWMDVRYEPGEIRAVAYDNNGNKVAEETIRTAGKPHHVELVADKTQLEAISTYTNGKHADCPDMAFVTVRVVDKDGNLCPNASNLLKFQTKGNGARFNSACNGDATSLEPFTIPQMHTFNGQLVVVVEATTTKGNTKLTVSGKGLKSATLTIETK